MLRYKIHCNTENADVFWYLQNTDPSPTKCCNDTSHDVDLSTVAVVGNSTVPAQNSSGELIVQSNSPTDPDFALLSRTKVSPIGWTYQIHGIEFQTSVIGSVLSKDQNLTNFGFTTQRLYKDEIGTQCTDQTDADATCIKTVIDWEPTYDYEIIGGHMRRYDALSSDLRIWVIGVPDVPAVYGGSKLMIANANHRFLNQFESLTADGRTSKHMVYSPTYHTNKLRFVLRHSAGFKLNLHILIELYKA